MSLKIYVYKNCSTCQKALRFLEKRGLTYETRPIIEEPPKVADLKRMLEHLKVQGGSFKNLFNTSGQMYRELAIADQIKAGMTETEALRLLAKHGKLIKRPFAFSERGGTVGFKEETWERLFLK